MDNLSFHPADERTCSLRQGGPAAGPAHASSSVNLDPHPSQARLEVPLAALGPRAGDRLGRCEDLLTGERLRQLGPRERQSVRLDPRPSGSAMSGGSLGRRSASAAPSSARDPLWYKDAIIYELHVRAFTTATATASATSAA